jgi:SAM-dependent methyltransferase
MKQASLLADAYVRDTGTAGFELVTRALLEGVPDRQLRIVDVGGGYGQQAIALAEAGHQVVVVDIDPNMLAIAERLLSRQNAEVRSRVALLRGDGASAAGVAGTGFDIACCHSVLMYEDDPRPLLRELVRLVRPGGRVSVISLNADAYAMRSGLQGHWREAAQLLQGGELVPPGPVVTRRHRREDVATILDDAGATVLSWYGLGVFTDHLTEALVVDDPRLVYEVEWLAGSRDPYRQVARCFHLIAERRSLSGVETSAAS